MSSENAGWGRHGLVPQGVSLVLSALLILSPGWATWTAAEDASTGAASGALSIATDPPGASTYIDGQFVGATPINVDRLVAGDHRVRVVKGGYLENGRIVHVTAGKSNSLHVKLTPHTGDAAEASQIVTGGGGGGGSRKWLWIGLAGGGAAIAAVTLVGRNKAPTAGSVVASPATALAAATTISFSAQGASDPDGDALTFTWDFGDGTTGTGATPTKVYTSPGTFTVTMTVSDGKKSATATGTVTVRSMAGTWRGSLSIFNATLSLGQSGSNFSGSYADQFGTGTLSGTVSTSSPRVRFTVTVPPFAPFTFTGDPGADANSVSGTVNGSGFVNTSWTLTRQ